MLLIYLIFPLMAVILDYFALQIKGTMLSFVLAVVAIGLLIIGLPLILASNTTTYASQNVITAQGTITIQSFNQTQTNPASIQSLTFMMAEITIFPQLAYLLLMLAFMFTERKRRRYS